MHSSEIGEREREREKERERFRGERDAGTLPNSLNYFCYEKHRRIYMTTTMTMSNATVKHCKNMDNTLKYIAIRKTRFFSSILTDKKRCVFWHHTRTEHRILSDVPFLPVLAVLKTFRNDC